MGAPGTRPDEERAGVGRGGMGAPGTDDVTDAAGGGGPGATRCEGGCGDFGCGGGRGVEGTGDAASEGAAGVDAEGAAGLAGAGLGDTELGRHGRSGMSDVRGRVSPGKGWRGPLGTTPPAEDPGMGRGAGRAGIEMDRLIGPGAAG
jgi:hypothetical protein